MVTVKNALRSQTDIVKLKYKNRGENDALFLLTRFNSFEILSIHQHQVIHIKQQCNVSNIEV